jgi:membrane protein
MTMREVGRLLKGAGIKFWDDGGPRLSAAITFYLSLYLSPLLLAVIAIAGFVFGKEAAQGEVVEQIRGVMGREGAEVVEQILAQTASTQHGIVAGVVAVVTLFIGASGLFSCLQGALDVIWQVPGKKSGGGILVALRERLFSFLLVCGTAFLLIAALIVNAVVSGINGRVSGWLPHSEGLVEVLNFSISYALITTLFAMIFKWLPETRLAWSDVWLGAAITTALIALARYPIGLYLNRVSVGSAFGAAEAFVVFLVWVYYAAQIVLFGAEFTFVYANRFNQTLVAAESPAPVGPAVATSH